MYHALASQLRIGQTLPLPRQLARMHAHLSPLSPPLFSIHFIEANPSFPGNFARAIREFDKNDDGLLDMSEFQEINRRYPLLLFPAFRVQDHFHRHTFGETGWMRIMENTAYKDFVEDYQSSHNGKKPRRNLKRILRDIFELKPFLEAGGVAMLG